MKKIQQMPALVDKLEALLDYGTNDGDYFVEDNGSVVEFGVQSADMYGDMLDNNISRLVQSFVDNTIFEEISGFMSNTEDDEVIDSFDESELSNFYLSTYGLINLCVGNPEIYAGTLIKNGFGVFSSYDSCKETGIYHDIQETIINGLECKYLKANDIDMGSGAIVYTIPTTDFNLFVAGVMRGSGSGDISPEDFMSRVYQYRDAEQAYHMVTEPYYGWDGFDSETWDDECDKFYAFLKDLFLQFGKERD